jgi:tetrapyrrole methylase family protein/MazG family protein
MTEEARRALEGAPAAFLRTSRHPAAEAFGAVPTFDHHYEAHRHFEEVYRAIVEDLVAAATAAAEDGHHVVYAVPGSPVVAERSVELLVGDPRLAVSVCPAVSFVEVAWARLGVDPVELGATVVDPARFASAAASRPGPFLVAQCWSQAALSSVKLSVDGDLSALPPVTVLHHLGLSDEQLVEVPFAELDHFGAVDHLTSLFVPSAGAPVGPPLAALDHLAKVLRRECPWDAEQTHRSLRRHLLEESYEVVEALDELAGPEDAPLAGPAADHLAEELGDLLFQVVLHAALADEEGLFNLAQVAEGVHDKLVGRHPHVFGDVVAETPAEVASNWEVIKAAEKGRRGVLDGVTLALPALSLAQEIERKGRRAGLLGDGDLEGSALAALTEAAPRGEEETGRALLALSALAAAHGVDAELALRRAALALAGRIRSREARADDPPRRPGGSPNP